MAVTLRNTNTYKKNQRSSLSWKFLLFFIFVKAAAADDDVSPMNNNPNQLYQANRFDTSVNFRQNICSLVPNYDNNNRNNRREKLAKALKGFEIRAALGCPSIFCQTINLTETDDGSSSLALDPDNPGLYAVLMDELAKRAGFRWRDTFAFSRSDNLADDNKTFTDLLIWDTETYDLSVNWWAETTDRIRDGIDFPEGWYDAGIIMVQQKRKSEIGSKFNIFGWIRPFTGWVWFMIVVTIISSGLVYYLMEKIDERSDRRALEKDPVENIFLAGVAFTTHFEFNPRTKAAMLFTLSVSFWAMLTASAYTANLASFLVVQNTPGLQITSLEDAVDFGYQICVYNSSAIDTTLTEDFENRINLKHKPTEASALQGVMAGECDIAAVAADSWRIKKVDQTLTTDFGGGRFCDQLEWVGRKYKEIPAGFATRRDVGRKCTSLITDVIDIHMREMIEDGFVEDEWEKHLAYTFGEASCIAKKSTTIEDANSSDNLRLNMTNMGGIFLTHFVITGLVLAITFYNHLSGRNTTRNERLRKEERETILQKIKENMDYNPPEEDETSSRLDVRDSAIIRATTASSEENYAAAVQESIDELRKMQHIQSQSMLEIKQHLLQLVNEKRANDTFNC